MSTFKIGHLFLVINFWHCIRKFVFTCLLLCRIFGGGGHGLGQILEYIVLVDDAGHNLKGAHVEHVNIARLKSQKQMRVVVEKRESGQSSAIHYFGVERVLFDLFHQIVGV